jgi:hypothetical protein
MAPRCRKGKSDDNSNPCRLNPLLKSAADVVCRHRKLASSRLVDSHAEGWPAVKFEDAIHSCKCGAFIRDESGTMAPGWKIFFVAGKPSGGAPIPRNPDKRVGDFFYRNPHTGSNYMVRFTEAHKVSDKWTTVI